MISQKFQKILFKDLLPSIGGYFYKRKSYYFDKKGQPKQKFSLFSKKYEKRYFKIDINASTFSYAKTEDDCDRKPDFTAHLRDIISVKENLVSMPFYKFGNMYTRKKTFGATCEFKSLSISDVNADLDKGPNCMYNNVLEVMTTNRLLTLYTNDSN